MNICRYLDLLEQPEECAYFGLHILQQARCRITKQNRKKRKREKALTGFKSKEQMEKNKREETREASGAG